MCIVQRYALVLVALFTGLAGVFRSRGLQATGGVLALLSAIGGAYTAASQSWLQWNPPEVVSCGRDLYGMIETFPLKRALPMIFRGGGDCSKVDWSLFGLTLANWSFVAFVVLAILLLVLLFRGRAARCASAESALHPLGGERELRLQRQGVESRVAGRQPGLDALALQ